MGDWITSLFTYRNYSIGLGITMSNCIGYFAVTILLMFYLQGAHLAEIIPLLIISAATGLSWPSLAKAVLSAAPQERAGSASGMFWTVYEMCRAISQALSLVVVQLSVKSESVLPLFSNTGAGEMGQTKSALIYATNNGFRFFAIFFVIAILLGLLLMRPQLKKNSWKEEKIARQSG